MNDTARQRQIAPWLFALLAIGGLAVAVRNSAELKQIAELAGRAKPAWLLAGAGLQAATYFSVASGWRLVLKRAGQPQPLRKLTKVAVSKLFADQALPGAGISGNVLLIDRLTALGTTRGAAMATLLVSMIGFYAAYSAKA